MKIQFFTILYVLLVFSQGVFADSPATSTPFSEAYLDIPLVKIAQEQGVLNEEMCRFLTDLNISLDQKAALVNALGWKFEGKKNTEIFTQYLMKKYRFQTKDLPIYALNRSELMCLGYLKLLDDYFHPLEAMKILERALKIKPKSFTVNIVTAIARGQVAFDYDWCQIWCFAETVLNNKSLEEDFRPEATSIIVDYLILYRDSCFE